MGVKIENNTINLAYPDKYKFKQEEQEKYECYTCYSDGPLFYLCNCIAYGLCKKCTLDIYNSGVKTCTICKSNYTFDKEYKQVFNHKKFGKSCGVFCLNIAVVLFWFFNIIGFSYDEQFKNTWFKYKGKENDSNPYYIIACVSIGLSAFAHVVLTVCFVVFTVAANTIEEKNQMMKFRIAYHISYITCQVIGIIIVFIATNTFMFNIITFCIGSLALMMLAVLIGIIAAIGSISICVYKEYKETYFEERETIKFPTSV